MYTHFAGSLIGEQMIQSKDGASEIFIPGATEIFIPIFLIFKFLFFIGWLSVAVSMYNPFGSDDADIELIDILDRHIKVVYKLVDVSDSPVMKDVEFWKPSVEKAEDNVVGLGLENFGYYNQDEDNDDAQDKLKMMLKAV